MARRECIEFKKDSGGTWYWQWHTPRLRSAFSTLGSTNKKSVVADARRFAKQFIDPPDVLEE